MNEGGTASPGTARSPGFRPSPVGERHLLGSRESPEERGRQDAVVMETRCARGGFIVWGRRQGDQEAAARTPDPRTPGGGRVAQKHRPGSGKTPFFQPDHRCPETVLMGGQFSGSPH